MIILIIGDFGVGKDTIADMFVEYLGEEKSCKIKSWTTREPRCEGEDTHCFMDKNTFLYGPVDQTDRKVITFSKIGGHYYWTEASQFMKKDYEFYVIDKVGAYRFLHSRNRPDVPVYTIEVKRPKLLIKVDKSRLEREREKYKEEISIPIDIVYNNYKENLDDLRDDVMMMAEILKNVFYKYADEI